MSQFRIERAVNGQFYGTFLAGNNEMVWKTPETYHNKEDVINAIRVVAVFFNFFVVTITDNSGGRPVTKEAYFDGDKVLKVLTVKKVKNAKSR